MQNVTQLTGSAMSPEQCKADIVRYFATAGDSGERLEATGKGPKGAEEGAVRGRPWGRGVR